jgi:hypothetical protein
MSASAKKISIFIFTLLLLLLAGAGAFFFWKKNAGFQQIAEIIPEKGLEFVLVNGGEKNLSAFAFSPEKKEFYSLLPLLSKKGVILSYSSFRSDIGSSFLLVEPEKKEFVPPKGVYCENFQFFSFCAADSQKDAVFGIIDAIKNDASPFSENAEWKKVQPSFSGSYDMFFFGKTDFLLNQVEEGSQNFLDPQQARAFQKMRLFGEEKTPFFSGKISDENLYFSLEKKESTIFFPLSNSVGVIDSKMVSFSADRYFFFKNPEKIWNSFFSLFEELNIENALTFQASLKESAASFLGLSSPYDGKLIDFDTQIFPLFTGDIFWQSGAEEKHIIYSLPSSSIAESVFTTFSVAIDDIIKWSIPMKVPHVLEDGTTVYEVFPNDKSMVHREENEKNKKMILFKNIDPNTQKDFSVALAQKASFLLFSDQEDFLEVFLEKKTQKKKNTLFPVIDKEKAFFSFGYKKRADENLAVDFLHIFAEEKDNAFVFSGKIQWNPGFFLEKKSAQESTQEENLENNSENKTKDTLNSEPSIETAEKADKKSEDDKNDEVAEEVSEEAIVAPAVE